MFRAAVSKVAAPLTAAMPAVQNTLIKTVNQMGFMNAGPSDEYISEFIQFSSTTDGTLIDLGCAFGHKCKLMLDVGAKTVMANDLAQEHLDIFEKSLTDAERRRVILKPGNALQVCSELPPESLTGVLAANILPFLNSPDIRQAFGLFYRILKPNGMLTVVCASLKNGLIRDHQDEIERRKEAGDEWPGWIPNMRPGVTKDSTFPGHMMFCDPYQLVREAHLAGFLVKKFGFIGRPEYPDDYQLDGREASGLIAIKPNAHVTYSDL